MASDFPILSMLVVVPAAGALLVLLMSKRQPGLSKMVATIASTITAVLASSAALAWVRKAVCRTSVVAIRNPVESGNRRLVIFFLFNWRVLLKTVLRKTA